MWTGQHHPQHPNVRHIATTDVHTIMLCNGTSLTSRSQSIHPAVWGRLTRWSILGRSVVWSLASTYFSSSTKDSPIVTSLVSYLQLPQNSITIRLSGPSTSVWHVPHALKPLPLLLLPPLSILALAPSSLHCHEYPPSWCHRSACMSACVCMGGEIVDQHMINNIEGASLGRVV